MGEGPGKEKIHHKSLYIKTNTGEMFSPVSKNNCLLRNRTGVAGTLF